MRWTWLLDPRVNGMTERDRTPGLRCGLGGANAPIGKGMAIGILEGLDQLADSGAAGQQLLDQRFDFAQVAAVPLGRDLVGGRPDGVGGQGFEAREPGVERLPAGDAAVDIVAIVDAAQGRILEAPLAGVEAVAEVDEDGLITALALTPSEDRLAAVGVGGPLVEGQDAGELGEVLDL